MKQFLSILIALTLLLATVTFVYAEEVEETSQPVQEIELEETQVNCGQHVWGDWLPDLNWLGYTLDPYAACYFFHEHFVRCCVKCGHMETDHRTTEFPHQWTSLFDSESIYPALKCLKCNVEKYF